MYMEVTHSSYTRSSIHNVLLEKRHVVFINSTVSHGQNSHWMGNFLLFFYVALVYSSWTVLPKKNLLKLSSRPWLDRRLVYKYLFIHLRLLPHSNKYKTTCRLMAWEGVNVYALIFWITQNHTKNIICVICIYIYR